MTEPHHIPSAAGPGEPRWPAVLAVLAVGGLYLAMPDHLTPGPNWGVLAVIAILLAPLAATHHLGRLEWNHAVGLVLSSVITAALIWSVGALIFYLPEKRQTASGLLLSAGSLWATTVLVFACWYWRLDAGGPHVRDTRETHSEGAFLFPQMTMKPARKNWRPGFVDYLFLAFTTSTAFSPTDTPPLTGWAKMLMMTQSALSLSTLAILAGRAVNMF